MLLLLFIVVPALELGLLIKVGSRIGVLYTVLLIIFTGVAGFAMAKNEGLIVLDKIKSSIAQGIIPKDEIIDGSMILIAGALLFTPGFITDSVGLLILFPLTRPMFRKLVKAFLKSKSRHYEK